MRQCYNASALFRIPLILIFLLFQQPLSLLWAPSLGMEDYEAYSQSNRANPLWDPFVKEGFDALDREDFNATIEFLKKAVLRGCESPIVTFKLGLAFEATGSYYSAVQYYELAQKQFQSANKDHRYTEVLEESMGRALYFMGDQKKALAILKPIAQKTNRPWILKLLGTQALKDGDSINATSYFERLLKFQGAALTLAEKVDIYTQLARAYRNQNEIEAAQRYYEEVVKVDPQNPEASEFLHILKQKASQQERKQKSDEGMEKAIQIFDGKEKH